MKRFMLLAATCAVALPAFAQNVATVNGKAITKAELNNTVQALVARGAQDTPEFRKQLTEELINRAVLVQAAEKAGIDKKDEVALALNNAKQEILIASLLQDWSQKNQISDAEIQKTYDELVKENANKKEYKVKHILVKDETAANNLLKSIKDKKAKFADVAKKESIDSGSGKDGGELGWAPAENYVPEFANAVKAAKKGELVAKPVKSQFGWHIIQVEDERAAQAPKLEEVKPQLQQMLSQQALQKHMKALRDEAKVEVTEKK
ncbi:MAG: peptidylprolyl isomerase [Advenella sp.]